MDKPNRILIIQLKRAGDVIVTTPVLTSLRETFPNARIDFLTDAPFASVLLHHPALSRIHIYDRGAPWKTAQLLRKQAYDWIVDFQSSPRSILVGLASGAKVRAGYRVLFWGQFFSFSIRRPGSNLSVTEGKMSLLKALWPSMRPAGARQIVLTSEERAWAESVAGPHATAQKPIGLIATHRRASRRWLLDSFVAVGQDFAKQGRPVWLFWGPGEEAYVVEIRKRIPESWMIPKTSMREMAALLERCDLVITNDNGPMHTASAVGAATITIYGPTEPLAWNPGGDRHRVLQAAGLACLGCNLNQCPFQHECMAGVSAADVLRESQALLRLSTGVMG